MTDNTGLETHDRRQQAAQLAGADVRLRVYGVRGRQASTPGVAVLVVPPDGRRAQTAQDALAQTARENDRSVGSDTIHAPIAHGNAYDAAVLTTLVQEPRASRAKPRVRTGRAGCPCGAYRPGLFR